MGLLNKSELHIKQFSASDPIIKSVMERLFARKEKDILDGPLKRVYIVKSMAPWLGGE